MMTVDYRHMQYYLNQQGTPATAYAARVLATSPRRYNKLNEGSGSAIVDSSGNGYTGTYTGVTWDGTQSPFVEAVPFFDGANDYGNLYSAAFGTAFNMDEFTVMLWFKMNSAAVWSDGISRYLASIYRDATNTLRISKSTTANSLIFTRVGGGVTKAFSLAGQSDTGFVCVAISASVAGGGLLAAGEMRGYKNGVQVGATQTGNVAAIGSGLSSTVTALGAFTTTPIQVHHGYLAQLIIWNRPIDAGILALMTP